MGLSAVQLKILFNAALSGLTSALGIVVGTQFAGVELTWKFGLGVLISASVTGALAFLTTIKQSDFIKEEPVQATGAKIDIFAKSKAKSKKVLRASAVAVVQQTHKFHQYWM